MPNGVVRDTPLAPHTTLGVGGVAEFYVEVTSDSELEGAVRWAKDHGKDVTILGGGSNVLIDDRGIPGLVITPRFQHIEYREDGDAVSVVVGAGASG